ncbi:hypothetical protein MKX01_003853 [Papaver californicum]|nr:hypothetical protein MKX01_003853 [Papaver californicum]
MENLLLDYEDYDYPPHIPSGLLLTDASPEWLNKADNAWVLIAAALVGLQSVPGLIILYGSMVKKKWAVNSAFMALYAFAAVLLCWVLWAHQMSFASQFTPLCGKPGFALSQSYLLGPGPGDHHIPIATYVFYEFAFAAITVILIAGSLLGRMNFYAWMLFVPLWLTFSYSVGAYSIWGENGFLQKDGEIIDFSGGYVIHLSSGVAGFTAAYWVGPRIPHDRQHFPPNNIIHMLGGARLLWLGWSGFNGGSPLSANMLSALAILNTHFCTAISLLVWMGLDMYYYKKSSVSGAVQGMITGLVCITPGAGLVEPWAALVMGILAGLVPWYTMMVHKKSTLYQLVDDPLAVFHTHAVAGLLGGILSGIFAKPNYLRMYYGVEKHHRPGLVYSVAHDGQLKEGLIQMGYQLLGAGFVFVWNVFMTSLICIFISKFVNLRMSDDALKVGDDAAHGEEAYALWGDGERLGPPMLLHMTPRLPSFCRPS